MRFASSVAVIVCLASSSLQAETFAPSVDATAAGRGGANFAFDDNGFVLNDNPAGLIGNFQTGNSCSRHFYDVSMVGLFPDLEYADDQNPKTSATNDPCAMGAFTIGRQLDDDVAVGFGVYTPAGFHARWTLEGPPALPGPQLYKSLGMLIRVLPGISYQATDRLRLGANLGVAISHIELEGPYFINSAPLTGTPTLIDLQSTGTALTWAGGLQYQATDNLILAARYQSQNRFQNDGNARVAIPAFGISSAYDMKLDIVWPRSLGGGLQYALNPCRRVGLDVEWQQWSRAYDEIGLLLRDPSNPVFQQIAGPSIQESLPLQWNDSIVVKSGIEQDLDAGGTVRVGYGYNSDAVIGGSANVYLPTTLQHYFTGGYTARFCCWEYNLAYQYSFRPTMHVGDSGLAGDDFANSSQSTQAHWLFLGLSRKY